MSYEPVDVTVRDRAPGGEPLSGVKVRLFSEDGGIVYGEQTTGEDGVASFLLPAPVTYQARFYKFQVDFERRLLEVRAGEANRFEVYGTPFSYPQATDPRLCLASGFLRRPDGSAAAHAEIAISTKFNPIVLDGAAVFPGTITARTDARGYAQVHLIRGACYEAVVEGLLEGARTLAVPLAPAVNLAHLLLPVVASVAFDVDGPYALSVGGTMTLRPTVTSSDLRELPYASDVRWSVSDPRVASLELGPDALTLRGLAPGSFELRAERSDRSIVSIPNRPIAGAPLAFTVA